MQQLTEDMQDDDPEYEHVGGIDGVSDIYESSDGFSVVVIHFETQSVMKLYAPEDTSTMLEPLARSSDEYGHFEDNLKQLFCMRKVLKAIA